MCCVEYDLCAINETIWNVMDKLKERGQYALNACWNVYIGSSVRLDPSLTWRWLDLPVTGQYLRWFESPLSETVELVVVRVPSEMPIARVVRVPLVRQRRSSGGSSPRLVAWPRSRGFESPW